MKRLLLLLLITIPFFGHSSHILSGQIQITHLSAFNYKLKLIIYTDPSSIGAPSNVVISSFERVSTNLLDTFHLSLDTTYVAPSSTVGCSFNVYELNRHEYTTERVFSPNSYNDPGGYLFTFTNCCRNAGYSNISNPSSQGFSYVLMFPPVIDVSGNQIINNSPVLNDPVNDFVVNNHPYFNFFGGYDADGDSLSFVLSDPLNISTSPSAGVMTSLSAPYPDPSTQFSPLGWAPTYNTQDQIHGVGPNPSPDRFQIDEQTGIATLKADELSPTFKLVGIWCREFRNGQLIGSVFRDFSLMIIEDTSLSNQAPALSVQTQSLSSWNADTLEFTGSPVCIQISVTDPDTVGAISLFVSESAYNENEYSFAQSSTILRNQDTFVTALCIQPDSFLSYPTKMVITAMDEMCYESSFDSIEFYIRFSGYSNAGKGGNIPIPITASLGNLDLFSYLNGNPNTGGTWLDLDNTGLLSSGQFDASGISSDVSYRFAYIDQQPNYPADTAELELNFFIVQGVTKDIEFTNAKVYPNPNSGNFIIEVPENLIGKRYTVYSPDLKRLKSSLLRFEKHEVEIEYSGMYFLKIEGSEEIIKIFIDK